MKVFCKREEKNVECEMYGEIMTAYNNSLAAHVLCDKERQDAYDKIRELQQIIPAHDEDYRYRVEQIAARIVAACWENVIESDAEIVDHAIRLARKLVCAVEAMDRG